MRKLLVYVSRKPVEYSTALQWQRSLLEERTRSLRRAKALGAPPTDVPDALLLLEHTPVYTLGRSASEANVLFSRGDSGSAGVTFKDDRALDTPQNPSNLKPSVHRVERFPSSADLVGFSLAELWSHGQK